MPLGQSGFYLDIYIMLIYIFFTPYKILPV